VFTVPSSLSITDCIGAEIVCMCIGSSAHHAGPCWSTLCLKHTLCRFTTGFLSISTAFLSMALVSAVLRFLKPRLPSSQRTARSYLVQQHAEAHRSLLSITDCIGAEQCIWGPAYVKEESSRIKGSVFCFCFKRLSVTEAPTNAGMLKRAGAPIFLISCCSFMWPPPYIKENK